MHMNTNTIMNKNMVMHAMINGNAHDHDLQVTNMITLLLPAKLMVLAMTMVMSKVTAVSMPMVMRTASVIIQKHRSGYGPWWPSR